MPRTTVTVNDRMQRNYRYECTAPVGLGFDPEFRPELTPPELLRLGVFDGKYMTDSRGEFPSAWFREAKLSPTRPDRSTISTAGRHLVPQTATAGAAPLGLRQPKAMERNSGSSTN